MDNSAKTDVFKFVALRPPTSINERNFQLNFIEDSRAIEKTPIAKLLSLFNAKEAERIPEITKDFINSTDYKINYPQSEGDFSLSKIHETAKAQVGNFDINILKQQIYEAIGMSIDVFLKTPIRQRMLENIWDRYYAFYVLGRAETVNPEILTIGLQSFHLLDCINRNLVTDVASLQRVMTAQPLIPKVLTILPKPVSTDRPPTTIPNVIDPEKVKEYTKIWTDILETKKAIDEVKTLNPIIYSETKDVGGKPSEEAGKSINRTTISNKLVYKKSDLTKLQNTTQSLLTSMHITDVDFQVPVTMSQLQNQLNLLYQKASNVQDEAFLELMPKEVLSYNDLSNLVSRLNDFRKPYKPFPIPVPNNVRRSIKPLGVGDLKVVKQKLKKYMSGEVAHIENVLKGEYKERKHRVLDRTEEIFIESKETEETTDKDTQSTERFELAKESEKTIKEKMDVQAGVTVSGSYGMVTFGAYGDFAYGTSSEESNKTSSNFAKEVINKSVSKIQKKTSEERTEKQLHEVEEINTHGIDNKNSTEHTIGIYRWVDKYYEAQIFNYGKRMMFEFIIPEPAAFFEYAQNHQPKQDLTPPIIPYKWIQDSEAKWITDGLISHKDINEFNYQWYIRDYNTQGVTPPPPLYKTISSAIFKDGMPIGEGKDSDEVQEGASFSLNNQSLVVPSGYVSKVGVWFDVSAIWTHFPKLEITIGNKIFRILNLDDTRGRFNERFLANSLFDDQSIPFHTFYQDTIIQVSVNSYDVLSYTVNLYALVERLPETYEQWQIETYEKIMNAYKAMQMDYDQKNAAQKVQQGIVISGQNPLINREIEKVELKKQCIKLLMDTYTFGLFDAMKANLNDSPDFDIFDAINEGKTIQFFEQAFEWENLTYLFYPYFWARKTEWIHKSSIFDNDPLFTKFLQAGSVRVVLPVHPGYNDAVMYYLENDGALWGGGDTPKLQSPLFISLADELKNQTDDIGNAVPEGEPWEVIIPTTLVYLQQDSELPDYQQ
ncbi:hypothetical protein [Pedobacter nototheniae]|uniref:hypothetical protein n=1 Tax=Pedobacter nototheniae TaxID=2488994 RepID=UPI00292F9645|nr:hypothetical protein [Pedobacter nototheniae]